MLYSLQIIMGRKRKPDHPRRMMSDVLHNRTSVAPPSEDASHRPPSEGPLVPPPSEGPLVPPHRPPSVAPQQLPCTQPPCLPSVRPPSVAPQQLSSSAYEPSAGMYICFDLYENYLHIHLFMLIIYNLFILIVFCRPFDFFTAHLRFI